MMTNYLNRQLKPDIGPAASSGASVPISNRTSLVTLDMARACLGIPAGEAMARVEDGRLPWAWDLAASTAGEHKVREVRLWVACLSQDPAALTRMTLPAVIAEVIGSRRERFSATELSDRMMISHQSLFRLVRAGELSGELAGHVQWISRRSLEKFLTRRKLG
jgi:hypothetical protein